MLPPWVSHSLRDLSSLLPSVSSELLGDELVPASFPRDSASRTVPQHSLSAKAQRGCSVPRHRSPRHPQGRVRVRALATLTLPLAVLLVVSQLLLDEGDALHAQEHRLAGTAQPLGAAACRDTGQAWQQSGEVLCPGAGRGRTPAATAGPSARDPRGHERVAMRNYTPARLHLCACAGTEQRPQVCVCKRPRAPVRVQLCLCGGMLVMPVGPRTALPGDVRRWLVVGKGCCWVTHT